jgi:hypothetical protein
LERCRLGRKAENSDYCKKRLGEIAQKKKEEIWQ